MFIPIKQILYTVNYKLTFISYFYKYGKLKKNKRTVFAFKWFQIKLNTVKPLIYNLFDISATSILIKTTFAFYDYLSILKIEKKMNIHTKEYLQNTIQFKTNGFKFTYNESDNHLQLFETTLDGKKAEAYGNKARWEFLQYIESHKQDYKHNDKTIVQKLKSTYPQFDKEWGLKETEQFFEKNSEILHNMMHGIDTVYFSTVLNKLGILNNILLTFAPIQRGVAASTSIQGNQALIKMNLLQFISWDDHLRGSGKTSMGTEKTTHIFESMLKSFSHELVHALIIVCSPIIKINNTVVVHPRHLKYDKWRTLPSYAHHSVGDINYSNVNHNANTGHGTMFMRILKNQFGQEFDYHDNYNVQQKHYGM